MKQFNPSVSMGVSAALRVAVFFVAALFLTGCMTVKEQGDRSYEAEDYKEAQKLYKQAMAEGSEDADLYVQAARTELKLGNLASAERYFARALRFGGGSDVARELARYYIQTSNYASAVRVYQYLLYQTDDPQPVYNNLGTALIYAGQPFDAESYLLVAQQMDPEDPFPYLNLGLLYDEHLKQPWLAVNFYECFAELAPNTDQSRRVQQRVGEIQGQWGRFYDPTVLDCGEVYKPRPDSGPKSLKDAVEQGVIDLGFEAEKTLEKDEKAPDVAIDRMVESLPERSPDSSEESKAEASPLADGRKAFAEKNWQTTIDSLTAVPLKLLQPRDLGMLGAAYYQLEDYENAVQWLNLVTSKEATPDAVKLLIDAQFKAGQFDAVGRTCARYGGPSKMEEITTHCEGLLGKLETIKNEVPKIERDVDK